ncbi:MAG: hypothetical protein M3Q19_15025 [Pseudomonadota bacterium]|nr:hypothetical protein [Pseudomonadota bacterium]
MLFGTIKNSDEIEATGSIQPENGDADLQFEESAALRGDGETPKTERRLSYEADQPVSETLGEWGIEQIGADQYRAKGVRYAIARDAIAHVRPHAITRTSMVSFALAILIVGSALAYSFW